MEEDTPEMRAIVWQSEDSSSIPNQNPMQNPLVDLYNREYTHSLFSAIISGCCEFFRILRVVPAIA